MHHFVTIFDLSLKVHIHPSIEVPFSQMVQHECTTWNQIYFFPLWVWATKTIFLSLFFSLFFLVWLSKSETHCLDKVAGERKKGDKHRKVFLLLLSLKDQPWAVLILPIMHCPNTAIIYLTLQISRVQKWGLLNSIFQIYGLIWGFRSLSKQYFDIQTIEKWRYQNAYQHTQINAIMQYKYSFTVA